MNKIMAVVTLLIVTTSSFSQHADTFNAFRKAEYLRKSKNQKTAAWVLLSGGVVLSVTGVVIYNNAYNKAMENDPFGTVLSLGTNVDGTGAVMATIGTLAAAASIPFFIVSGKNKRKANSISTGFKMESMPAIQRASVFNRSYPAVSIKLGL